MSEWFPSNTRASKHQYAEQYVLNEHGTLYFTLLIEGEREFIKSPNGIFENSKCERRKLFNKDETK